MVLLVRVSMTGKGRVDFGGVWSEVGLHAREKDEAAALLEEVTA
jgi:hypothetical protein